MFTQRPAECKSIALENWKVGVADIPESPADTELVKKYKALLMKSYHYEVPMLRDFLRMMIFGDETHWYLLTLLNFLALSDQGSNEVKGGGRIGDKLFMWYRYMQEQKEKYEIFKKWNKMVHKKADILKAIYHMRKR